MPSGLEGSTRVNVSLLYILNFFTQFLKINMILESCDLQNYCKDSMESYCMHHTVSHINNLNHYDTFVTTHEATLIHYYY